MKHPIFHPDEEARIGPYPHSGILCGRECKILRSLDPIYGEHRYLVELLDDGTRAKVLELTLRKKWSRSDWRSLRCSWYGETRQIWQPPRAPARRPTSWKEFK